MSRRVVLFYPATGFDVIGVSVDLPLAVLNVAAYVADAFDVCIIDQRVEPGWRERLRSELEREPLALGISSMTCPQILNGMDAAHVAREVSPKTIIVWGGVHPTLFPLQVLRSGLADVVVRGWGEVPFRALLHKLVDNAPDLSCVRGISFLGGTHLVNGPEADRLEIGLDEFPPLPYRLLEAGVEAYVGSQGRFANGTRALIMITSLGCPYRCGYCATPMTARKRLSESAGHVVQRVVELVERFGINAVAFHDEEFLIDGKRAIEIARGITERLGGRAGGFRWWCQARMDSLERLCFQYKGSDGLRILWESGLESFQPGIESGSDRILRMVEKRETVEQFVRVNRLLAEYEFWPLYNFMVGFPTETVDEMLATLRLAVQMLEENPRAMVAGVYVLVPYPGTKMFNAAVKAGFRPPTTMEEWAGYNRQHTLTPWLQDKRKRAVAEFARITSRFVDGRRLARRLGMMGLDVPEWSEEGLAGLAAAVQVRWKRGDVSEVELFEAVNNLAMGAFRMRASATEAAR